MSLIWINIKQLFFRMHEEPWSVVSKNLLVNGYFRKYSDMVLKVRNAFVCLQKLSYCRCGSSWACGLISAAKFCFPVEVYSKCPTPFASSLKQLHQQAHLRALWGGITLCLSKEKSASFLGHENASTAILKEAYSNSLLGVNHIGLPFTLQVLRWESSIIIVTKHSKSSALPCLNQ